MGKSTKVAGILQRIADDIVHGRRAPGTALDEVTLAREFAVSRTPVREALRQLEMSGLVEARPHRGATVSDISPDRLDDMFAVMAELEALCTRWAARAMTAGQRLGLRQVHEASALPAASGDTRAYASANDLFHDAIYDGSDNGFLAETTRHTRLRLAPFRRVQFDGAERLARSHAEHGRILALIEARDAIGAEAAMREHMRVVRRAVDAVRQPDTEAEPEAEPRDRVPPRPAADARR